MCGIVGSVQFDLGRAELESRAQQMAHRLAHRGPDSEGYWADEHLHIGIGHRRLAIHDLTAAGHQPMLSASGRFVIAFNGEIYNYQKLKALLISEGIKFLGDSDTEVLVNAIESWGLDVALARAIGMYAFALVDRKVGTLTLARDRIGEKPLYFGVVNESFYFASELKSILAVIPSSALTIDKHALAGYLRFGYISAPRSIYTELKKLDPCTHLTIDLCCSPISLHGCLPIQSPDCEINRGDTQAYIGISDKSAIESLDSILHEVIGEQALADVPLGAFLSGGIDSSVVSAILQAQSNVPINTFTIGFDQAEFNEAEHAKAVSKHLGTSHQELYLSSKDALNVLPGLTRIYDEPFADSSAIPMILVSKMARKKVTVCLSGDGGDELFCGYNRYFVADKAYRFLKSSPESIKKLIGKVIAKANPYQINRAYDFLNTLIARKGGANFGQKIYKFSQLLQLNNAEDIYLHLSSYWHYPELLLLDDVKEDELFFEFSMARDFLKGAMLWDQRWYLPGDNLVKTDRASMDASIELRLPLLDSRVVAFSRQINSGLKYRDGISKWLLRQVLYRYVPPSLIDRPKMGFSIPIGDWLRGELREWAETLLDQNLLVKQALFNNDYIQLIWSEHLSKKTDHGNKLWTLLIFQDWYVNNHLSNLN